MLVVRAPNATLRAGMQARVLRDSLSLPQSHVIRRCLRSRDGSRLAARVIIGQYLLVWKPTYALKEQLLR